MSRQVMPIIGAVVGAVIGWFAGGPSGAVTGAQYGFVAGSIVGPIVDPIILQGNRVGDNQLQVAAEGGARAILIGRGCITATCVIARGDRQVVGKKEGGGKGSGPKTANEYVYWTYAIGLGEALVGSTILRVWKDENLVYDIREESQRSDEDNAAFAAKFRFYDGSETQLPDPALQSFLGDDTPYFRGTAYVVFPSDDLTNTGERIPIYKFEMGYATASVVDLEGPLVPSIVAGIGGTGYFDADTFFDCQFDENAGVVGTAFLAMIKVINESGPATGTLYVKVGGVQVASIPFSINNSAQYYSVQINHAVDATTVTLGFVPDTALVGSFTFRLLGLTDAEYEPVSTNADPAPMVYTEDDPEFGVVTDGSLFYMASYEYESTQLWRTLNTYTIQAVGQETTEPVSEIVSTLLQRTGMTTDEFDVTELEDDFAVGVVIQETMNGADAVASVVAAYFADPTEYDGKLRFVKRGKDVIRVLTVDDLVEEPELSSRENAVEYPAKLHLFYQSPKTGYAMTKATSNRYSPNAEVVGEGSVIVPITFDESTEPANIAAKLHKVMWNEAGGDFSWTVGDHCLDLVPTDTLALLLRGVATRVRITAMEVQQGRIKLIMRKDRQSAYTADVQTIPLPTPTPPPPSTVSLAVLAVMDIPALTDSSDDLYYWTAMSGLTQVWRGGQLQESMDGGATWSAVSEVSGNVPMGRLTAAMAAASQHYPDNTNVIAVQLFDPTDELNDLTQQQWLSENGAIAVQAEDGSWELMQYRDAVDEGNGLYTLSMLQRGRLNTAAVAHAVDALVVVLDNNVQRHSIGSARIDTTLFHRAVSYNTSPELATDVETEFVGKSQREWPVASFSASAVGSSVVVSNIVPRHRFGTEDVPVRSANWIGYRIICTNAGGQTVTVDTTNTTETINVSSIGVVTTVSVQQLNRITGAGDALVVSVSATGDFSPYEATVQLGGAFTTGVNCTLTVGALLVGEHLIVSGDTNLAGVATALAADINAKTGTTGYSAMAVGNIIEINGPPGVNFDMVANTSGAVTALVLLQYVVEGKRSRGYSPVIFSTAAGKLYAQTDYYLGPNHGSSYRATRFWESPDFDGPFTLKRTRIGATTDPTSVPLMTPAHGRIAQTTTMALRFDGADSNPWNFARTYFALTADPEVIVSDLPSGAKPASMCSDGSRIVMLAADGKAYSTTDGETWTDLGAFTGSFPLPPAFNNSILQKIDSRWFLVTQNSGGVSGEVNSNVIFYNDGADPVGAWTTAAGQPAYTRAPGLNLHEEMASDGTNVYLFVNNTITDEVIVFVSSDDGANWMEEETISDLSVFMVQIDNRGSPVKIRLHGADSFSQKDVGTSSWSAAAANDLSAPVYGVVISGHAVVSDEQVIKRDVNGVFTETLSGFEGLN